MSMLIKGLTVPKDGMIGVFISSDGNVYDSMDDIVGTIVPVPPHGRLIDVDAIFYQWYQLNFDRKISDGTLAYWNTLLGNAPTIIEAEVDNG